MSIGGGVGEEQHVEEGSRIEGYVNSQSHVSRSLFRCGFQKGDLPPSLSVDYAIIISPALLMLFKKMVKWRVIQLKDILNDVKYDEGCNYWF
jgi:hypothetical protein